MSWYSIKSLHLRNLLSFGPHSGPIGLGPLNVVIGPNGSGKSNLLEALRVLRAAPHDLTEPFAQRGGIQEWVWKGGGPGHSMSVDAEVVVSPFDEVVRHALRLVDSGGRLHVYAEKIWETHEEGGKETDLVHYVMSGDKATIRLRAGTNADDGAPATRDVDTSKLRADQCILSQRNDPDTYAALSDLAYVYRHIGVYTDLPSLQGCPARRPQLTDLPQDVLLEDGSNLPLVLSDLRNKPESKRAVLDRLRRFSDRITDYNVLVYGGTAQLFLEEKGLPRTVPATRISDGTLRFLYLAAVLCHPEPPGVICLEEPEIGMHPDAINLIAEMLVEASTRSQVIVTTHSDLLVSALSDHGDSVLVCEMTEEGSRMKRLESAKLAKWLEKYSLGDLWLKGEIGGTRW